ncbi:MAG: cytochrome c [Planctomycetota bacterium]
MRPTHRPTLLLAVVGLGLVALAWGPAWGDDASPHVPDAAAGRRHLLETAYVPAALDQEIADNLWRVWSEPLRTQAAGLEPAARRGLMFRHYGFDVRPGDTEGPPLQMVVTPEGTWHMSCFTCHAGHVAGQVIPGLPNAHLALQSLVDDVAKTKRLLGRKLVPSDLASSFLPFGETVGTTNAVVFSISLLRLRDANLDVVPPRGIPRLPHHDLDAPPWWHLERRRHLYIDGFAKPNHRALMQFLLVPQNGRNAVLAAEDDFRDIEAYVRSIQAPRWPFEVDGEKAARGGKVYETTCADCHGTYGEGGAYPETLVPIDVIGTDRVRLDALTVKDRTIYSTSWLTGYDPTGVRTDPGGYVAPPLDGIWASAPYLHNGSVPTLWHLLRPDRRPAAWRRDPGRYDEARVGLVIEEAPAPPATDDADARRRWFDTTKRGKSPAGHDFPAALTDAERDDLLEYLKTL